MDVIHSTSDELLMRRRPVLLAAAVAAVAVAILAGGIYVAAVERNPAGYIFAAGGLVLVWSFWKVAREHTLRLSRPEGHVSVTMRYIGGRSERTATLDRVAQAEVASEMVRRNNQRVEMFRPVLVLRDGTRLDLSAYGTSSRRGAEATAQTINRWLGLPG